MSQQFKASADSRFLSQKLATADVDQIITYDELSEAIGRDVRRFAKSALYTALRNQVSEGRVFEVVPKQGYRRLSDKDIIGTQFDKGRARIARTARRTAHRVQAVNFDNLDNSDKIAHNTQISMLGAVAQMARPQTFTALQEAVKQRNDALPVGDVLSLMNK